MPSYCASILRPEHMTSQAACDVLYSVSMWSMPSQCSSELCHEYVTSQAACAALYRASTISATSWTAEQLSPTCQQQHLSSFSSMYQSLPWIMACTSQVACAALYRVSMTLVMEQSWTAGQLSPTSQQQRSSSFSGMYQTLPWIMACKAPLGPTPSSRTSALGVHRLSIILRSWAGCFLLLSFILRYGCVAYCAVL